VTDTLNDRIEAHEALAEAAMQHLSLLDVEVAKGIMLGDPLARHIAANDPATIEAFCAVARAAEAHMTAWDAMEEAVEERREALYEEQHGQFISAQWKADLSARQAEANATEHRTAEALHAALAALYDALGRSK
jgi:hypothetical protein